MHSKSATPEKEQNNQSPQNASDTLSVTQTEPFNNPIVAFLTAKRLRWLRHSIFIVIGLILAFKGDIGVSNDHRSPELNRAVWVVDAFLFAFIMGEIYLLLLVLLPRLLYKSKVFLFSLCFFVLISLIYFVAWYSDYHFLRPLDQASGPVMPHIEFSIIAYVQIIAVAAVLFGAVAGVAIFKKWITDLNHLDHLRRINHRAELEQLKSQVNPHFLFNTLNNLVVLTKIDSDKAVQVLLGLSDLLRYQLYDTSKEQISLSKDIEFIHNLLSLEKIRKNDFDYVIETCGNPEGVKLSPFLFIPFVENAVKHGASTVGHSFLRLKFMIGQHQLVFMSENSVPAVKAASAKGHRGSSVGGLGLANIKRRLQLLYPGNHTLHIVAKADIYSVNLTLPL